MEEEELVQNTIDEIISRLREKLWEMNIPAHDYTYHFNQIHYIESEEKNEVILQFPNKKGTYHNWTTIKIEKNGKVTIQGVETSPQNRNKNVGGNGYFNFEIQLDDWQEPEAMEVIREKKLGKYNMELGMLDLDENDPIITKVNTEHMWDGIFAEYPEILEDESKGETYTWYGEGLPKLPCIEYFREGTDLLIITPEQATKIIRENQTGNNLLYANVNNPLAGDCFDININDVEIYVMDNEGILETEDIKKAKYEEYKEAVLEYISPKGKETGLDILAFINDDLINDEDFLEKINGFLYEPDADGIAYEEWVDSIIENIETKREQIKNNDEEKNSESKYEKYLKWFEAIESMCTPERIEGYVYDYESDYSYAPDSKNKVRVGKHYNINGLHVYSIVQGRYKLEESKPGDFVNWVVDYVVISNEDLGNRYSKIQDEKEHIRFVKTNFIDSERYPEMWYEWEGKEDEDVYGIYFEEIVPPIQFIDDEIYDYENDDIDVILEKAISNLENSTDAESKEEINLFIKMLETYKSIKNIVEREQTVKKNNNVYINDNEEAQMDESQKMLDMSEIQGMISDRKMSDIESVMENLINKEEQKKEDKTQEENN